MWISSWTPSTTLRRLMTSQSGEICALLLRLITAVPWFRFHCCKARQQLNSLITSSAIRYESCATWWKQRIVGRDRTDTTRSRAEEHIIIDWHLWNKVIWLWTNAKLKILKIILSWKILAIIFHWCLSIERRAHQYIAWHLRLYINCRFHRLQCTA